MYLRFIITLLLIISIFISCQKEFENPNDTPVNVTSEFRAKVNDAQFVAAISGAVRRSDGVISMAAQTNEGKTMAFTLVDSGVHIYTLGINSISNFCGYEDSGLAFSSNEGITPGDSGGNLAITSIDTVRRKMSGTFNLKVFRQLDGTQRTITEGVFNNITY